MATKSILKNIYIKDKKNGRSLVFSLEAAKDKKAKPIKMTKTVKEIRADQIGELFGEK
ncbi:hypothetical protein [Tindallia californiensis]|uniref:Uncharacterized protein n=1 Tax=Tindallia californiensis TaxID=159292 RepID=A0A1H3QPA6_9FIRM|nr:hypothetical protein [Tindallia californiensis]SDZ15236.1 hypothetical protein SAMN05192546_11033 [Tindallia californiensis]